MDCLITKPDEKEFIFLLGKHPEEYITLFDAELIDPSKLKYLEAYNKMVKLLEEKTGLNETINLYVSTIDFLALGAITAFINLIPNKTKMIEKATQRTLNVWITDYNTLDSDLYGVFQHIYTLDKHSGIHYGRTISRIDLEIGLPDDTHIH